MWYEAKEIKTAMEELGLSEKASGEWSSEDGTKIISMYEEGAAVVSCITPEAVIKTVHSTSGADANLDWLYINRYMNILMR